MLFKGIIALFDKWLDYVPLEVVTENLNRFAKQNLHLLHSDKQLLLILPHPGWYYKVLNWITIQTQVYYTGSYFDFYNFASPALNTFSSMHLL